jgi:hypothetical protein
MTRLPTEYRREVETRLDRLRLEASPKPVTEADLAALPDPVRRYVRRSGAIGRPRVRHFRARSRGRIRGGPADAWMPFVAEQHNFPLEAERFFLMRAKRGGLPVDVLHAFHDGAASMRVRVLSFLPIVTASGPDLTRAETVTLLNDLVLLAPGALIAPNLTWKSIDERSARVRYTLGSNTVGASLEFNEDDELTDFVSDDRLRSSADGKSFTRERWSTPVGDYKAFGAYRAMGRGEGRWHLTEGDFTYIELDLLELDQLDLVADIGP